MSGVELTFRQGGQELLPDYATIPIDFEVQSRLDVGLVEQGLGGMTLREVPVSPPYWKDYDAMDDNAPSTWPDRFDTRNWLFILAELGNELVGAATVAMKTPLLDMLEGRSDLAVLWDIRVAPDQRGNGVGRAIFQWCASWARSEGCRQLKVETQDVNVGACRFYAALGCELGQIHRHAYSAHPDVAAETMLCWYLDL